MQFVFTGFTQELGFRVFAFQGVAADRSKTAFLVRANIGVARTHGIHIQELPLLCREFLEHLEEGEEKRAFTFTEDAMRTHETALAARRSAAAPKRPPRRPVRPQQDPLSSYRSLSPSSSILPRPTGAE